MFEYEEAEQYLIEQLSKDAQSHTDGYFSKIGNGYDFFDANLPRANDPRYKKLFIALYFWDGWQDARNHEWKYYEGINSDDWPQLANIIIQDLNDEKEIEDQRILKHFDVRPHTTMIQRLKSLFGKSHA